MWPSTTLNATSSQFVYHQSPGMVRSRGQVEPRQSTTTSKSSSSCLAEMSVPIVTPVWNSMPSDTIRSTRRWTTWANTHTHTSVTQQSGPYHSSSVCSTSWRVKLNIDIKTIDVHLCRASSLECRISVDHRSHHCVHKRSRDAPPTDIQTHIHIHRHNSLWEMHLLV